MLFLRHHGILRVSTQFTLISRHRSTNIANKPHNRKSVDNDDHHGDEDTQTRSFLRDFSVESIPRDSCTVTFSRSSGPGGQNVNKVNTKATLRLERCNATWIPPHVVRLLYSSDHTPSTSTFNSDTNSRSTIDHAASTSTSNLIHHDEETGQAGTHSGGTSALDHAQAMARRYITSSHASLLITSQKSRTQAHNVTDCFEKLARLVRAVADASIVRVASIETRERVQGFVRRERAARMRDKVMRSNKKQARRSRGGDE